MKGDRLRIEAGKIALELGRKGCIRNELIPGLWFWVWVMVMVLVPDRIAGIAGNILSYLCYSGGKR